MDIFSALPYPYVSVAAVSLLLYLVAGAVNRLYFSPIASFPGPKLAALTFCPAEIHVETPSFADELYNTNRRRDKWERFTRCFGIPDSDAPRRPQPVFSTASVRRLQPVIEERLDRLLERFAEFQETGETMAYAFARCEHRIEDKDFDLSFHDASMMGSALGQFMKQFPWVITLMQALPDWVAVLLNKDMALLRQASTRLTSNPKSKPSNRAPTPTTKPYPIRPSSTRSSTPNSPPAEKSFDRLWQDGQVTVVAGTLTTAWALSVTHYHLANPSALAKLKAELASAIPDPFTTTPLATLERLPYLAAVIQESLRLSCGVSTRLQRIAPVEALCFTDPASGTLDARYFPVPLSFRPERWLENPRLDRFCLPFSKGSRQCVGMGLAYAEIFLALARIWRVYGSDEVQGVGDRGVLRLEGTDGRDVTIVGNATTPLVWKGTKGVRIVVR
ncbi:putative benzoate 4-monooxygenase cytochrome P450 [Podospora appendiculata]|uniref:Benzoate 4-monooxygenase cytochrome P450 n=1 Tax=Podospora appendiculata TaxID=314037 RepID=A0AAE0X304_9PEZI|nr:putative benzoate 4-monooxygenase cytochrome P450 [Podospora appendiculata]KAK3683528.1 putative benzoate 4-monooxygenase cytochrome P450 [Podospora appendiculata]